MRKQVHIDDLADELQMNVADIRALIARGELTTTAGAYVSRASVERYRQARTRNLGELGLAVMENACHGTDTGLRRFYAAAASMPASEASGADGGFAVPASHSDTILRFRSANTLVSRCRNLTTERNSIELPTDHKAPWDPSGGVKAALVREGEPIPQSIPAVGLTNPGKLGKLAALVPVSDELLEDAPALGAYLEQEATDAIGYVADLNIYQGIGGALPIGIINSPARVEVAAEDMQTAQTVNSKNVSKMFAAMLTPSLPTSAWVCHPDVLPQLIGMTVNGQPIYETGDDTAPAGRLLGRPVIPHEVAEALGSHGDIAFVDFGEYLIATKDPQMRSLTSLHIWFERSLMAFKFIFRMAGAPAWAQPVTSRVGGGLRSPFVTLAARPAGE